MDIPDNYIDPQTRDLIKNRMDATNKLSGDWEKDTGVAGGFQPYKAPDYGFGESGANNAIQARANERFLDPSLQNMQALEKYNYAGQVQKKMKEDQKNALGQLRFDNARMLAIHQRNAQEEAQRASLISSIFQIGGTIVGGVYGGPMGAAAGGAAGSAVGGKVAGGVS